MGQKGSGMIVAIIGAIIPVLIASLFFGVLSGILELIAEVIKVIVEAIVDFLSQPFDYLALWGTQTVNWLNRNLGRCNL